MRKLTFYIILFLLGNQLFAQKYVGGNFGYKLSNDYGYKTYYLNSGLRFEKKLSPSLISIYLEETFEKYFSERSYQNLSVSYLKTTVGFDINAGNKMYFIIGFGLAPKFLIKNEWYNSFQNFVLDGKFNSGLGFNFNDRLLIKATWQIHINITPYRIWDRTDHFGNSYKESERESTSFPQITFCYLLGGKS